MGKKTTDELVSNIAPKRSKPKSTKTKTKQGDSMKKSVIVSAVSILLTLALVYATYSVYTWGKRAGVQSEKERQADIAKVVSRVDSKN